MGMCVSKAGIGMFIPPLVSVKSIEFKGIALAGVKINVTLEANNKNPSTLHAKRITYKLQKVSDETLLAEGTYPSFDVPAMDVCAITIPVTFKYLGIGAASKSIIKKKETCVAVSGDITFDAPLTMDKEVTIPFSLEQKIVFDDIISLSKQ